jgi:membrane-associated phospholipid phosphatase
MTRPHVGSLLRAWWPGVALIAIGVFGYLEMLEAVREQDDLWALDDPLVEWFAANRTGAMTQFMVFISWVFGPVVLPILVAIGGGVWGSRTGQWFNVGVLVGSMIVAALLSVVLKYAVDRPRPPEELWQEPGGVHMASFPSGHTLCAATLVMVTGYLAWRTERSWRVFAWWAVASILVTGIVALSRLYLGYHFLTDVVAGFFAALTVLGLAVGVVRTRDARLAASSRALYAQTAT